MNLRSQPTSGESSKALITRFWDEAWNPPYSMDAFDDLVADNFTISTDGNRVEVKEPFSVWLQDFQSRIGDLKTSSEEILFADDETRVITRMHVSGFNKTPLILLTITSVMKRRFRNAH